MYCGRERQPNSKTRPTVKSVYLFFFFKQKTAYEIVSRDWSSDVCSSDLPKHLPLKRHLSRALSDQSSQCSSFASTSNDIHQHDHLSSEVRFNSNF